MGEGRGGEGRERREIEGREVSGEGGRSKLTFLNSGLMGSSSQLPGCSGEINNGRNHSMPKLTTIQPLETAPCQNGPLKNTTDH